MSLAREINKKLDEIIEYNIQLDAVNNDFKKVCDDGFKNAYYKYSSNGDEVKHSYLVQVV